MSSTVLNSSSWSAIRAFSMTANNPGKSLSPRNRRKVRPSMAGAPCTATLSSMDVYEVICHSLANRAVCFDMLLIGCFKLSPTCNAHCKLAYRRAPHIGNGTDFVRSLERFNLQTFERSNSKKGTMAGNKSIYDTAMKRAHEYAWANQWERAMKEYGRALSEFPNDRTAQRNMAQCMFRLRQWPQAL